MAIDKKAYKKTKYQNIKVDKSGTKFWFDFTIAGTRTSKLWTASPQHTKADRLRMAQKELERLRDEKKHKDEIQANYEATVDDYFKELVLKKKNTWSPKHKLHTEQYYENHVKKHLGHKIIKDMKPLHFSKFNTKISHLGLRAQKLAYEILIPIMKNAVEDEIILVSPIKSIHIPKRNQLQEKKIIHGAIEKYRAVHKSIMTLYKDDPHHRALFLFGFYGRRKTEVLTMQWTDIDFINNVYMIRSEHSKVKTDMQFMLPMDVKEALLKFKEEKGNVFNIKWIEHQYKLIAKESGVEEFTFHWMRNLSVSALSAMGVDSMHLSSMLGHQDTATLKKYLSLQREASTSITNEASQKLLS